VKRILFFSVVIGSFFLLISCSSPPPLAITADKKKIDTVTGSYCWSGAFSEKCVDTLPPSELLEVKKYDPVKLPKAATINLKFDEEPQTVEVRIEQSGGNSTPASVRLEDNKLTLPQENGIYLYHIFAKYSKGTVTYMFSINVE